MRKEVNAVLTVEQEKLIREAKREYKREWRRAHPENVKAAQERYWLKRAGEIQQRENVAD